MDVFETQDIQCGHMITYREFIETFNAISQDYHAWGTARGGMAVVVAIASNYTGNVMASLDANSCIWDFKESSFNDKELDLMSKLAGNMPEFRGKIEGVSTMVEEITIKELLERAGVDVDSERYQELASYIAAHAVYAVELNDNDSEKD